MFTLMSSTSSKAGRPRVYERTLDSLSLGAQTVLLDTPSKSYAQNVVWKLKSGRIHDLPGKEFKFWMSRPPKKTNWEVIAWREQ